jgi:hypothetical protein
MDSKLEKELFGTALFILRGRAKKQVKEKEKASTQPAPLSSFSLQGYF